MLSIPTETDGAEKCFLGELYQKNKTLLYITARKYVAENDCEDVVQDAVVRIAQNVSTIQRLEPKAVTAYLVLTVRSAAVNYLKHQKVIELHSAGLTVEEACCTTDTEQRTDGVEVILLRKELAGALYEALGRLTERDQILLYGKYYLGLSDQELQEIVGCKTSSVRMLLTRARRALIVELEKDGIIHG